MTPPITCPSLPCVAGIGNVRNVTYDKYAGRGHPGTVGWSIRYVAALCSAAMVSADRPDATPVNPAPLKGEGLPHPNKAAERTALSSPSPRPMS